MRSSHTRVIYAPPASACGGTGSPISVYSSDIRCLAYSMLFVCASFAATLTASDTAADPWARSSSETSTERGTCAQGLRAGVRTWLGRLRQSPGAAVRILRWAGVERGPPERPR